MKNNIGFISFIVAKDNWDHFASRARNANAEYNSIKHHDGTRYVNMLPENFVRYMEDRDFDIHHTSEQIVTMELAKYLSVFLSDILYNLEIYRWVNLEEIVSKIIGKMNTISDEIKIRKLR